jgi:N-acetylmuramoyl-L-alanine amidase
VTRARGAARAPLNRGGAAGRAAAIALIAAVALMLAAPIRARAAAITGASLTVAGNAVELRFEVRGRGLRWNLSAHNQELWIDLEHAKLELPARPIEGQERPPIAHVSAIGGSGGRARIVVEVNGKVDYAIARLPHELAIRLARSGDAPALAAPLLAEMEPGRPASRTVGSPRRRYSHERRASGPAMNRSFAADRAPESGNGAAREAPSDARAEVVAPERMRPVAITPPNRVGSRPLVMVDPGHGGHDPGTSAADGAAEKNVALEIARQLQAALEARGVDAELTRAGDNFLSLADRTRLANRAGADLFISIHLNSSPAANTTGIESYYLNNTTDRATIRLARMENGVAGGYGAPGQPNLNYILSDLRQGYKANESASLARMIEAESAASIAAGLQIKVNALGAKKGPFYVLVGADMPSVLIECGFLSNPGEARLLQQPDYQRALAGGIAAAVVHYFNADAAVGNL